VPKIKVCEQEMEKVKKRNLTSQFSAASSSLDDNEFDISNKHVVLELRKEVDELQNDSTYFHCIVYIKIKS